VIWKDEVARLRPPVTGPSVLVGVWMEEDAGYPWIRQAILELRQTAGVKLAAAFILRGKTPAHPPGFYQQYQRKCRARVAEDDPFVAVDLRAALEGVPILDLHSAPGLGLDVVVRLSMQPGSGECRDWARYGVWSLGFGDPERYPATPSYFWEIPRRDPVSTLLLYVHQERLEEAKVIYRYESATRYSWNIVLNAIEPLSMAPVIVARRLRDLQQYGGEWLAGMAGGTNSLRLGSEVRYPNILQLGWLAVFMVCRGLYNRFRFLRSEAKWFVCLRRKRPAPPAPRIADTAGFSPIPNPPGSSFADPFLFEHQGKTYLFVEEIVTELDVAYLCGCVVSADGTPGNFGGEFFEVRREAYHLSYPCVFRSEDVIYLLPESAANRTVDLYRAVDFPNSWKLEKTLVDGMILVDTTPFFHEGRWYFFTSTVEEVSGNWLELWLFYSDRLDGEWHYHPRNPICSDVRRARGGGHVFYRNGKLIRPAQDCSVRYGYALVFSEVLKLSPTEYEEKPIQTIFPDWMRGIFATHTWSESENFEAIDATRIPN
jgi:hypothetical protein